MMIAILALAAGAGAVAVAQPAATVSTTDKAAIEKIVHDYILEHPEILPEAIQRLQAKEVARAVAANRNAIETPFAGAWDGAANGDVTLTEFFDYNCGYCRASLPDIDRLLKEDPRLRIVYREFPVLGPDSEAVARISVQAAKSGKYAAFHRAVFAGGHADVRGVTRIATSMGISTALVPPAAAEAEIGKNLNMQRALNLSGTPSWVVGNRVLNGAVGYDELKAAIAAARAGK